jgi:hypothetical protein
MTELTTKYIDIIRPYLAGLTTSEEFERGYLNAFKHESIPMTAAIYAILNDLFGVVERYCADVTLRGPEDADEAELRAAAGQALSQLESFAP